MRSDVAACDFDEGREGGEEGYFVVRDGSRKEEDAEFLGFFFEGDEILVGKSESGNAGESFFVVAGDVGVGIIGLEFDGMYACFGGICHDVEGFFERAFMVDADFRDKGDKGVEFKEGLGHEERVFYF